MNDSPRFDEARSAAIRSALIEAVEQSPGRDRRRHIRVAIAAVLAAIGLGAGGAAVAFALAGTGPFEDEGTAAAPPTSSAVSTPLATPSPTVEPATPAAHPLVVTGEPIAPHDILSPPSSTPAWTVQLPGLNDKCTFTRVIDVADGFALFQSGPTTPPEDSAYDCDLSLSRFALTMIDTSTGVEAWSREWSWPYVYGNRTEATLLGTSGRVLVWDVRGEGPREVLDLATGVTTAPVVEPAGLDVGPLYSVPGDSGDVSFVAQQLDAGGQPTTSWSVMRADPQDLSAPRWSVAFDAESAVTARITNSSSMLQVTRQPTGELDVYDVDSGALMVGSTSGRSYTYYDGFTLRTTWNDDAISRTVAGIDDAGNEIWRRSLPDTSYDLASVVRIDAQPGGDGSPLVSELMLIGPGTQLQLVDGVTGETRWTADGSACVPSGALNGAAISNYGFTVGPDDVLVQYGEGGAACGFDHASGAAVDVSERPGIWLGVQCVLAQYQLQGGAGTGGVYSDRMQAAPPTPMPQNGTATALDAVTGASLWTIPIYGDERWTFAGGYLVGFSRGKVFGIG